MSEFAARHIAVDRPGFYDDPTFQRQEGLDPEYLNLYGRYVARRPYAAEYLDRARREIPLMTGLFHREIAASGNTGACVDASMALSRILDQLGSFNHVVNQGRSSDYLPSGE